MSKLGILGATALSLTIAVASPAFAAGRGGGGGGAHFGGGGGGMHVGGGGGMGGGMRVGGGAGFSGIRGAQASVGPRVGAVSSGSFAGRSSGQVVQSGVQGNWQGGQGWRHHRGFGGAGFVAGLAAGSALGYGYGYGPYYDDYAYNDYYDDGSTGYVVSGGVDPASCAQRYRSWDPASQTYLGYDGLRHPCGE